jgi:hypothetical protein
MIDSVSSTSNAPRVQSAVPAAALRNNPVVLNAIVQTQQRSSASTAPVTALAVPQTSKSGNSSNVKLPRGSLVDVLA